MILLVKIFSLQGVNNGCIGCMGQQWHQPARDSHLPKGKYSGDLWGIINIALVSRRASLIIIISHNNHNMGSFHNSGLTFFHVQATTSVSLLIAKAANKQLNHILRLYGLNV